MTRPIIAVAGATGAQSGGPVRASLADPQRRFAVRALTRKPPSANAVALADAGAELVAALSRAIGEPVRHLAMSPAGYAQLGFPGTADMANMFRFKQDFNDAYCARRPVEASRALHPGLLDFGACSIAIAPICGSRGRTARLIRSRDAGAPDAERFFRPHQDPAAALARRCLDRPPDARRTSCRGAADATTGAGVRGRRLRQDVGVVGAVSSPDHLPAGAALAWVSADEGDDLHLLDCIVAVLEPFDPPWRTAPEALVGASATRRARRGKRSPAS